MIKLNRNTKHIENSFIDFPYSPIANKKNVGQAEYTLIYVLGNFTRAKHFTTWLFETSRLA